MRTKFACFCVLSVGLAVVVSNIALKADIVVEKSLNEMFNDAELVVICKPINKTSGTEIFDLKKNYRLDIKLKACITKLDVKQVLKGIISKEIFLKHYEISENNEVIKTGKYPNLLEFKYKSLSVIDSKSIYFQTENPLYLLYLKKSKEDASIYEPLTKIVNSRDSSYELYRPIEVGIR